MPDRDRAPIDQQWIRDYCDQFLKLAHELGPTVMQEVILRRVECCQDLVAAWQKRNWSLEERDKEIGK